MNEQSSGIIQSELPRSNAHEGHEFIQEDQNEEEQIMFVGISIHQPQLDDGSNSSLTILGLCTSMNNDRSTKRYKDGPTPPTPSTVALMFEIGLQGVYHAYYQTYPDHIIIYRNITDESELGLLQEEHGEIHEIKSAIREFYGGRRSVKFSYVAVVTNYSEADKENLEIVPNGSFMLEPPPSNRRQLTYMSSNIDLAPPPSTTCLTLATSSPDYDLNELMRLTTCFCESSGIGPKPNILLATTRFTNTMGHLLIHRYRTLQERQRQEPSEAEQGNTNENN